jgi:hypothetical protein
MLSIFRIRESLLVTNSNDSPLLVRTVMGTTPFCFFVVNVFVCDHNTYYYTFFV